jgi:hypothetical protein
MLRRNNSIIHRARTWTGFILPPLSLLFFCGAQCGSTLNTVELPALEAATVNKLADDNNNSATYCGYPLPYGTFEGLAPGTASVGYFRNYDSGSEPFACWWWVSSVDRGLVRFDLALLGAPAEQITSATLEYDLKTKYVNPGEATNCPENILASIWIVNEPWSNNFDLSAEFLTDFTPSYSCMDTHHSINVSSVVRDWLNGVRPNHGFLFVGGDESLPSNQHREHTTTLSNFKLKVLVAVPLGP